MIAMTQRMAKLAGAAEKIAREFSAEAGKGSEAEREIQLALLDRLWESGFLTLMIPREYDGTGAGFRETVRVMESLSRASTPAGLLVLLQCLGILPLVQYADEGRREKWLRSIVHERRFMAFALSEPESFSRGKAEETRAARMDDGYIVNGRKVFVSRGSDADLLVLFAVTDPDAGLERGLSVFLVERGTNGMLVAGEAERMSLRAVPWCELLFKECRVAQEQMIGQEGQGYGIASKTLMQAGPLLAAVSNGLMQRALDFCIEMIKKRGDEWTALDEFQPVETMLADMSLGLEASRALTFRAAEAFDENASGYFGLSRHAKVMSTDAALSVAMRAVEIFGNYGVLDEFPLKGILDDALVIKGMLGANTFHRAAMVREILKD